MPITTLGIGAAVTPTVVKTYLSHYTNRKPRRQRPTAHISYDEGLHLIRSFLDYASHRTVEDLQTFTAQWVPHPSWVRTENVLIPAQYASKAADVIVEQLGHHGVDQVGGSEWWQWRQKGSVLKAEWIEMRADYNARLKGPKGKEKSRRVMLYVHGGAYFFGSVDEHRYQMQRHARKLKARVFAPRYRLAPQFPFPCGLHDCLAAYLFLLTIQDPSEIILAGDSAGGGLIVSMLCVLRDRGLPLPAAAILISPWVDLTHSFPSLDGNSDFDYIPAHGFMQKPSSAWPPPNEDEIEAVAKGAISRVAAQALPRRSTHQTKRATEQEAVQGFAEYDAAQQAQEAAAANPDNPAGPDDAHPRGGNTIPGPRHQLSIQLDGKLVVVKDQIQLYTTNQLISHPLVSPVLQLSLGGLPPLLILTGGGEVLRDEQIYLAHKAANPSKYPLGQAYQEQHDPDNEILHKYKPTPVQLQVWEDLCHVAPTLSFTRPAKYMYRSIAQFGAWALARAQHRSIEITDDDNISVISSGSEGSSDGAGSSDSIAQAKATRPKVAGKIGRAGDPLPPFRNHMIRQRVDRHGVVYPLAPAHDLPALQMDPRHIGVIKPGPVRKWMEAKGQWDTKYASTKRKVQKQRIKDLARGGLVTFGGDETPPPSALAGRRTDRDVAEKKPRKSMGLAMWSGWGSKHDEETIRREEEVTGQDEQIPEQAVVDGDIDGKTVERMTTTTSRRKSSAGRSRRAASQGNDIARSRSRRRTICVEDRGQTDDQHHADQHDAHAAEETETEQATLGSQEQTHLSPIFVPKFKNAPHLRAPSESHSLSDAASTRIAYSQVSPDNASTTAVFAASGISKVRSRQATHASSLLSGDGVGDEQDPADDATSEIDRDDHVGPTPAFSAVATGGYDTPGSRRSVERLQSHQQQYDPLLGVDDGGGRMQPLRSPSTTAVVQSEGIVGVVEGGVADEGTAGPATGLRNEDHTTIQGLSAEAATARPGLYQRDNSEFQTAMEKL